MDNTTQSVTDNKKSVSSNVNYTLLQGLSQSNYVLYKDALETKEGKSIDASDIYIKPKYTNQDVDNYNISKENINHYLNYWKTDLNSDYKNLDYVVLDKEGSVIKSNNQNDPNVLMKSNDIKALEEKYSFYISIEFDENGKMNILDIYGGDEYKIRDNLAGFKLKNMSDNNDGYGDFLVDNPIKNMTFIYGINKDLKYSDRISRYLESGQKQSYSNIAYIYILILAGIIVILSLLTPLKLEKEISFSKILFKIPFEIISILMVIIIGFMWVASGELIFYTLNGDFVTKVLTEIGIKSNMGEVLVYLFNLLYWAVFVSLIFVSVVTIKNIFGVGLIKYFKENTLVGIILKSMRRYFQKACKNLNTLIENIDLSDKSNKFILRIIGIDAATILVFFILWVLGTLVTFSIFFSACWGLLLAFIYCVTAFKLLKKYLTRIKNKFAVLLDATNKIAEGNLEVFIDDDLGLFNPFKDQIVKIQKGFKKAVMEEVKSQRMKTELISNVSHDLKTPLTSIITYVDLLKNENISVEERKSYVDTIDKKSQRLKFLIEDLFEVSRATSGNINLNLVSVDIVELMKQTELELDDKIKNTKLKIRNNFPGNKINVELDSQKTFRVFENLLNNVVKYAMEGSRVFVDIIDNKDTVEITIKNMSEEEINFDASDIVERFERGDKSRSTEGAGLGLAIAKSFVEVQGGTFNIEVDGDLFKVIIIFMK